MFGPSDPHNETNESSAIQCTSTLQGKLGED